jgi:ParB family chromosome partitioning protein
MEELIVEKKINEIIPDKNQPRKNIDQEKLEEMTRSMITEGLINPIEIDENNVIVTGEMRWRACMAAGQEVIKCRVVKVAGRDRYKRQVIENIHNNTMNSWDTAKALEYLLQKHISNIPGSFDQKLYNFL